MKKNRHNEICESSTFCKMALQSESANRTFSGNRFEDCEIQRSHVVVMVRVTDGYSSDTLRHGNDTFAAKTENHVPSFYEYTLSKRRTSESRILQQTMWSGPVDIL